MCTLIVLHRCVPDRPLVVAANRDEFLERPAEGMALRSVGGPSDENWIVAPRDLEAGGTWVGLNARNVFVGLTNLKPVDAGSMQDQPAVDGSKLRSRGDVVMQALEAESAGKAIQGLLELEPEKFNPFQLLVADGKEAWLLVYRGEARAISLEPGPHIVGNVVDARVEAMLGVATTNHETSPSTNAIATVHSESRARKLTRIRARVEKLMTESVPDLFEGLAEICREHVGEDGEGGGEVAGVNGHSRAEGSDRAWQDALEMEGPGISPFESTCVHVADRYGTRSSLLLELAENPDANRLWTTEGSPCEWPYENRSSLLRELRVRQSNRTETATT
jgi:uncharacterized protein with NRDE domain